MPGTWCATPSVRCWWCASPLAPRQHRLRHRIRRKNAGPVAVKEGAGLPEKERQKCRDEGGAAPRLDLQSAHDQSGECKRSADEYKQAQPVYHDGRSGLKQRRPACGVDAPTQLRHENPVVSIEALVFDET